MEKSGEFAEALRMVKYWKSRADKAEKQLAKPARHAADLRQRVLPHSNALDAAERFIRSN